LSDDLEGFLGAGAAGLDSALGAGAGAEGVDSEEDDAAGLAASPLFDSPPALLPPELSALAAWLYESGR
jgi:hypothetical protein